MNTAWLYRAPRNTILLLRSVDVRDFASSVANVGCCMAGGIFLSAAVGKCLSLHGMYLIPRDFLFSASIVVDLMIAACLISGKGRLVSLVAAISLVLLLGFHILLRDGESCSCFGTGTNVDNALIETFLVATLMCCLIKSFTVEIPPLDVRAGFLLPAIGLLLFSAAVFINFNRLKGIEIDATGNEVFASVGNGKFLGTLEFRNRTSKPIMIIGCERSCSTALDIVSPVSVGPRQRVCIRALVGGDRVNNIATGKLTLYSLNGAKIESYRVPWTIISD